MCIITGVQSACTCRELRVVVGFFTTVLRCQKMHVFMLTPVQLKFHTMCCLFGQQ